MVEFLDFSLFRLFLDNICRCDYEWYVLAMSCRRRQISRQKDKKKKNNMLSSVESKSKPILSFIITHTLVILLTHLEPTSSILCNYKIMAAKGSI